jgi:hypothetical protein
MALLAWMGGAWKESAWKAGAWKESGSQPPPPSQPGLAPGVRGKRRRRNVEEDEAILLALLR